MNRSILKKYLTSKWIWLLLIELVVIGGLVYQFIPHKPTWGAVPQQIARIDLAPFAGGPIKSVPLPAQNRMYILTHAEKVVVFEDTKVITTFPTGHHGVPKLVIDEQRNRVYTLNDYEEVINIIEGTTVISSEVLAGAEPIDIAVNPTTGLAYVISNYEKERGEDGRRIQAGYLTVLDGPQVIDSYYLGPLKLTNVIVDPLEGYVYIGARTQRDGKLDIVGELIILKDEEEVARHHLNFPVKAMTANPKTGEVYLTSINPNLFLFKGGEQMATLEVLSEGTPYPTLAQYHPVTGNVYIVDFYYQKVLVVRDMRVIGSVKVGIEPANMVIDPLTGNVYVANARSGTVSVINGIELLDTIKVGAYPYGIGVNPNNGWVYVSNTNGDSVTILGFE